MRKNRRITPEGTRDLLFEECLARREVEDRLSNLFVQRGFSEVMTPGRSSPGMGGRTGTEPVAARMRSAV